MENLINFFNGKTVQYFVTDAYNTDENDILTILNSRNEQLPRNCILFVNTKNGYYQMYLIDNDGHSKQVQFPISFEEIRQTIKVTEAELQNSIKELREYAVNIVNKLSYTMIATINSYCAQVPVNTSNINILYDKKLDKTEASRLYQPKGNYLTQHQSLSGYCTLDELSRQLANYSQSNHTHDQYLTQSDLNAYDTRVDSEMKYANINHNHDTQYAYINHNHDDKYQPIGNYVKSITLNGTSHSPSNDGNVDLGTITGGNNGISSESDPTVPEHVKSITESDINKWNTASNKSHEHSNKSTLDNISSSDITNWNTAYNNRHTHSNKSTLDSISASDVINWNNKIDGVTLNGVTCPVANGVVNLTVDTTGNVTPVTFEQVQSDWTNNNSSDPAFIKNKPTLATVATSGNYNDLSNKPTIPSLEGYVTITNLPNYLTNYYTKTETNNLLSQKQDKLVTFSNYQNPGTFVAQINGTSIYWGERGVNIVTEGATDEHNTDDIWNMTTEAKNTTGYIYNPDSVIRLIHVDNKWGHSIDPDIWSNNVGSAFSLALGFCGTIGGDGDNKDYTKGNFSIVEGRETTVHGNYSHASGLRTTIFGDYSFAGGLYDGNIVAGYRDVILPNYITFDNETEETSSTSHGFDINGNYSFAYGKNLKTNNLGEIAFGKYNKSHTIEKCKLPMSNGNIAYDENGKEWEILDYYQMDIDTTFNLYGSTVEYDPDEIIARMFGQYYENYNSWPSSLGQTQKTSYKEYYYNFINKIFDIDPNNDELLWFTDDQENNYPINAGNYYNDSMHHPCNIREYYQHDQLGYATNISYHIDDFIRKFLYRLHVYKSNYMYTYEYGPETQNTIQHGINGHESKYTEDMIIGVIAKDNNDNYDFFIWGPDYLYYQEPITRLSIGNGNHYKRNNLFEITSDGNVYYDNGKKNLFELENKFNHIGNSLNQNVTNITNDFFNSAKYNQDKTECDNIYKTYLGDEEDNYADYYNKYLVIPINSSISSPFIMNSKTLMTYYDDGNYNKNIILFINENESNYLKRTIIIDSISYDTNIENPFVYFLSSKNGNQLKYNICINQFDDRENTYEIESDDNLSYSIDFDERYYYHMKLYKDSDIKYMYKIDIEIMNNICFINTKGYFQNGNYESN